LGLTKDDPKQTGSVEAGKVAVADSEGLTEMMGCVSSENEDRDGGVWAKKTRLHKHPTLPFTPYRASLWDVETTFVAVDSDDLAETIEHLNQRLGSVRADNQGVSNDANIDTFESHWRAYWDSNWRSVQGRGSSLPWGQKKMKPKREK
jgi:hypothetical protein